MDPKIIEFGGLRVTVPAPKAPCCFIPDDQQAAAKAGQQYTPCAKPAEWEIGYSKNPGCATLACTEHVGELLSDDPVYTVTPFTDA